MNTEEIVQALWNLIDAYEDNENDELLTVDSLRFDLCKLIDEIEYGEE